MNSYSINELFVGQTVAGEYQITEAMVRDFADASGDHNPLHLDEEYAGKTGFGRRIAHGMLLGSYISALIGMELPGEGTIYMKQELSFLKPVYYGDTIRVEIRVAELIPEKKRAVLATNCYNQENEQVIAGTALVKPRED